MNNQFLNNAPIRQVIETAKNKVGALNGQFQLSLQQFLGDKKNRLALQIFGIIFLFLLAGFGLRMCASKPEAPAPLPFTNTPSLTLSPSSTPTTTPRGTSTPLATRTFLPPPSKTPTPTLVARIGVDGMEQVFVPAGILHMGGFDTNAENDEFPSRELQMNAFWVDRFEVTNEMYSVCMEAGGCPKFHVVESQDRPDYFTNTAYKDYPVVNVSWAEAQGYCQWAGRRLPSEAEWERAARGDDLRTFPWGDDLPNEKYSNSDNIVSDTSRVGSYSAGASPFGAMDMAGNVWEWTADFYNVDFYANAGNQFPAGPTEAPGKYLRVIRGGSFLDSYLDLRVSNRGNVMGPNPLVLPENNLYRGSASEKIGFRCVSDQ